ncbi:MAG: hypothetical protein AD742_17125 [Methylibium sp. NZG]|nr:MAG: hypothetical protein AD742_17125 [Methylibium sp. NZG]
MTPHTRWLWLPALLLLLAVAWLRPLDEAAAPQVDAGLKRALASFAAARALNAVISVAQGTEVAVQPAGVGVTFAPGQALDPINDLVEQFSSLMLAASVSFGVQRALLGVGEHWVVSLLLTAAALCWLAFRWRGHAPPGWATRLLVGLLLLRFAVPVVAITSEAAFRAFLAQDYAAGQASIELSTEQFTRLNTPSEPARADEGVADRMKRWWSQTADVGKRFDEMKQVAARTVEQIVRLIVVFLMQTLVLPLVLMWGLWRLARLLVGRAGR